MPAPTATLAENGTHPADRSDVLHRVLAGLQSLPDATDSLDDLATQPPATAVAGGHDG